MSRNKTRTAPIGCGVMYAITLINDLIELSYTKIIVEIVTQTKKDYFFLYRFTIYFPSGYAKFKSSFEFSRL